jgi:predicted DNA-binding transcriptional regulator AlpA
MSKNSSKRKQPVAAAAQKPVADSPALRERQAAEHIGFSSEWLRKARRGVLLNNATPPPPYIQVGRNVRYLRSDLDAWLAARRVIPASR